MSTENDFRVELKPYQQKFIFSDNKFKFLKAGWGTGKSFALIMAAVRESKMYPENLGIIFRKELVDLQDSTIKDFEKYTQLKVSSHRDIMLDNKSKILFRHIEELNNIQNINLGWFGIEQAEELDSDDQFMTLFGRLRRTPSSMKGYLISNAKGHNWIWNIRQKGLYDKNNVRLDSHIVANTFDNECNLEQEFLDSLYVLEKAKPKLYNRMVLNSDDEDDCSDQIIPESDIRKAVARKPWYITEVKKIVAMDVARYGDDKTVLYALQNNLWIDEETYELKNTMETSGYAMRFMAKHDIKDIVVDGCGLGAGVVDRLREQSVNVIECNSAAQASDPKRWRNLRAEMWEHAADLFREGKVSLPDDPELINELSLVRYKTIESNGRLQVESKEDIKKRLGSSPDKADAFVMGLWAIDKTESVEVKDAWATNRKKFAYQWSSETC